IIMNFRRKFLSLSLSTVLTAGLFSGGMSVSAQDDGITRGDFANAVVSELQLTTSNQGDNLPTDMESDSPYANSVLALKEKKVIIGYPDGTFKPEQSISKDEAIIVLSKVLGIPLEQAEQIFQKEYDLAFSGTTITADDAT